MWLFEQRVQLTEEETDTEREKENAAVCVMREDLAWPYLSVFFIVATAGSTETLLRIYCLIKYQSNKRVSLWSALSLLYCP